MKHQILNFSKFLFLIRIQIFNTFLRLCQHCQNVKLPKLAILLNMQKLPKMSKVGFQLAKRQPKLVKTNKLQSLRDLQNLLKVSNKLKKLQNFFKTVILDVNLVNDIWTLLILFLIQIMFL